MIAELLSCLRLAFSDPRASMRRILGLHLAQGAETIVLILMAVGSALLLHLNLVIMPLEEGTPFGAIFASPIVTAILQFVTLMITALLIWKVGQRFGGHASLGASVLAVAWLQAVMLVVQVVQLLALLVMPPLSGLIGLAAVGLFMVLISSFIAEIHGFTSAVKVFFGALVTFLVTVFALSLILAPFIPPEMLHYDL